MGQKINPIGLRLGINRTWDSRWYANTGEYGKLLHEDLKIRDILMTELKQAGISKVVIERPHKKCRVTIHSARPGLIIGKKGADILRREFSGLIVDHVDLRAVKKLGFVNGEDVARKVISLFEDGAFDVATLFYSEFKSVIAQIPTAQQLVPAKVDTSIAASDAAYEYEPDAGAILSDLIPRNIAVQIFRALLENAASEQGARMSAMDNATRNAGEMIKSLTLSYNRQRQAQITKELIEIISGAEAL